MSQGFANDNVDYGAYHPDTEAEAGKQKPKVILTNEQRMQKELASIAIMNKEPEMRMRKWLEQGKLPTNVSKQAFTELFELAQILMAAKQREGQEKDFEENIAQMLADKESQMRVLEAASPDASRDMNVYIAQAIKGNKWLTGYRDIIADKLARKVQ